MKSINVLLASTFLAFSASLNAQIDTISSKTLLLKGKIKKVEDYSFFLDPDPKGTKTFDGKTYSVFPYAEDWNIEKDENKFSKTNIAYIFDNTGRNLEVITYNAENQPFGGMRFYYDKKGRVNKSQSSFSLGDGELLVNRQYFYNEKNRLVKIDETDGNTNEWLITITYKYDDLGNCIERNKVASNSALEKDIQLYEEKNLVLEKKIRPEYTREKSYKYNQLNKVSETEDKVLNKNVYLKTENEYNKEGLLSKAKFLNASSQETICTYKYNKAGRLIQSICTATDDPNFYVETNYMFNKSGETQVIKTRTEVASTKVYDEHNLLTSYITKELNYKYRYTFDKMGNWTQILMFENDKPICARVRKIEYFAK
ncbi:sugar-binding protein [Capnocytophaga sp. 051621]|jgi:putative YD repeat protein|uniref:Sugar-binding protein n=2 Tax=Capnocytophaga TaxID=1016 RepID=A0ABS1YXC3_9FLAO|nr:MULTISPECIES: sugar-binding protein [Capnocytophaga]MBI1647435.1 sugar-binding protein [Capnocytophaga periodontitidis]MBM0651064.1 sugar-binding protein [Capnocytophaga genosp. AHN8471]MBM0661554.1 sugar-binding protein [Capnocytophaga genosp. AHN8471]